ncbi:MAG: VWA domain-containing protein [Leptospiraceae bacterium]|nr:VWA domain-containing protein [Leptospiraceae bacterium]MCP5513644.1 VWA domain-containing protein [Leptospiraceae bacterium]
MYYGRPYFFFLMIIVLPLIYYRYKYIMATSLQYGPLQEKKPKRKFSRIYGFLALEGLLLIAFVFTLSDPYRLNKRTSIIEKGYDIAFALDISASMQAADFKPNRLEALKKITKEFVTRSSGNRIGVYVFAKDIFTQSSPLLDHDILNNLIDAISYDMIDHSESGGTAVGDALLYVTESLSKIRENGRGQAIILITDGENSDGIDPILAAKYAASKDIRLYIIGLAGEEEIEVYVNGEPFITSDGSILKTSLDDNSLIGIADAANGKYFRAKNGFTLNSIFSELSQLEKSEIEVKQIASKESFLPQFSILIFVLLFFRIGYIAFFLRRPFR